MGWRFGHSPQFDNNIEHRFDWGIMDLHISSKDGYITDVKLFSDSLYPEMIESITNQLKGAKYHQDGIENALSLAAYEQVDPTIIDQIQEYKKWLITAL